MRAERRRFREPRPFADPHASPVLARPAVARAGLDVYESEPHPHPALVASTRTTLLPHAAVAVDSLFGELAAEVLANVAAVVDTGKAVTMVNEREAGGGRAVSGGA